MTLPATELLSATKVPVARRPWALSEILAWAVVLLLATLAAVSAVMEQKSAAASPARESMYTFISQYLVGVHEVGKGGSLTGTDAQAMRQLEDAAKTPEDRVRLAIVAGEILGADEGVRRLDAINSPQTADDVASAKTLLTGGELPADTMHGFYEKYDWFSDLAQSVGKPAGDPRRVRTLSAAYTTLWTMLAVLGGGFGIAGIGFILLVIGCVLLLMGKIKMRFRNTLSAGEPPADRRAYLQGFAWYMAGMLGFMLILHYVVKFTLHDASPEVGAVVEFSGLGMAFALGILWPRLMGQSAAAWRAALGLHIGGGFFREVGSGLLGYLAGLPIMLAGIMVTALLIKITGMTASHPINDELTKGGGRILLVFVLASIWAPVTEELMFRGALFAHLRERFGWWISAPVVAVVFAIIHPQGWVALPVLASLALVFAGIREWRGSIVGCITAHAVHNTLTLIVAILFMRAL